MDTRLHAKIRECVRATLSDYVRSVFAVRLYTDMKASVPRNESKPFFVKNPIACAASDLSAATFS